MIAVAILTEYSGAVVIRIIGPHDKKKFLEDENAILLDVTSQSTTWTQVFSPFLLGPCKLYGPYGAFNVENAWQYAKVYKDQADLEGNPTDPIVTGKQIGRAHV